MIEENLTLKPIYSLQFLFIFSASAYRAPLAPPSVTYFLASMSLHACLVAGLRAIRN